MTEKETVAAIKAFIGTVVRVRVELIYENVLTQTDKDEYYFIKVFRNAMTCCTVNLQARVTRSPNRFERQHFEPEVDVLFLNDSGEYEQYFPDRQGPFPIDMNDAGRLIVRNGRDRAPTLRRRFGPRERPLGGITLSTETNSAPATVPVSDVSMGAVTQPLGGTQTGEPAPGATASPNVQQAVTTQPPADTQVATFVLPPPDPPAVSQPAFSTQPYRGVQKGGGDPPSQNVEVRCDAAKNVHGDKKPITSGVSPIASTVETLIMLLLPSLWPGLELVTSSRMVTEFGAVQALANGPGDELILVKIIAEHDPKAVNELLSQMKWFGGIARRKVECLLVCAFQEVVTGIKSMPEHGLYVHHWTYSVEPV